MTKPPSVARLDAFDAKLLDKLGWNRELDGWSPTRSFGDAVGVLDHAFPDYTIRRQNGHYWVTIYKPSTEWRGCHKKASTAICEALSMAYMLEL